MFLPGAARYGDLPGMLAVGSPGELWLSGEGDRLPEILTATYRAAEADDRLTLSPLSTKDRYSALVDWLVA